MFEVCVLHVQVPILEAVGSIHPGCVLLGVSMRFDEEEWAQTAEQHLVGNSWTGAASHLFNTPDGRVDISIGDHSGSVSSSHLAMHRSNQENTELRHESPSASLKNVF